MRLTWSTCDARKPFIRRFDINSSPAGKLLIVIRGPTIAPYEFHLAFCSLSLLCASGEQKEKEKDQALSPRVASAELFSLTVPDSPKCVLSAKLLNLRSEGRFAHSSQIPSQAGRLALSSLCGCARAGSCLTENEVIAFSWVTHDTITIHGYIRPCLKQTTNGK